MKILTSSLLAGLVTSLLTLGCGASQRMGDSLADSVTAYNDGVRWGRFPAAANHIPPAERGEFVDERDQLADDLRITDFELVRLEPTPEGALAHVKYTWFSETEDIVRETHSSQRWEQQGKVWLMVEESYLRGPQMPGLAPAKDDADAKPTDLPGDEAARIAIEPGSHTASAGEIE